MSTTEKTEPVETSASKTGWKKAAYHNILLMSGVRVEIRIPDLPALIEAGEIPQNLLEAALGIAKGQATEPSAALIAQQREFTDLIVLKTVTSPKLTEADLADIPYEDKEMLVQIATRQRDLDAEGEHIGGLTKSDKFRRFRGLGGVDEDVEDLSGS